jgi:hypothetical protein
MLDVMQIFGRAGRPQFDTSGEGIIITSHVWALCSTVLMSVSWMVSLSVELRRSCYYVNVWLL